ncbi:spore coat protein U, partial [Pseudomonas aeruginosa]
GEKAAASSQRYLRRGRGTEPLASQLSQDAAYSRAWGNGPLARTTATFPASTQTYTVYARLFADGRLPTANRRAYTV